MSPKKNSPVLTLFSPVMGKNRVVCGVLTDQGAQTFVSRYMNKRQSCPHDFASFTDAASCAIRDLFVHIRLRRSDWPRIPQDPTGDGKLADTPEFSKVPLPFTYMRQKLVVLPDLLKLPSFFFSRYVSAR